MSNVRRSTREEQILRLIAHDRTNAEIADELGISFATAKWHVSELLSKEGVRSREELADLWRAENGLTRRVRSTFSAIKSAIPAKVLAGSALLGVTAAVAAGFVSTMRPGDGSADGPDDASAMQLVEQQSQTAGFTEAEAAAISQRVFAQRIADMNARRAANASGYDNPGWIAGINVPISVPNARMTRIELIHGASEIEWSDGGRSGITPGDIWVTEWQANNVYLPEWAANDVVVTENIAFRDGDATGRSVGGGGGYFRAGGGGTNFVDNARFLTVTPPIDESVPQWMTRPMSATEPSAICLLVDFAGLPNPTALRVLVDDDDVSSQLFYREEQQETARRAVCLNARDGLPAGNREMRVEVQGTDGSVEATSWTFEITP